MAEIFLTNLPHNCSDSELRDWAESNKVKVKSTRIVLDLESGTAPAFGYIEIEKAAMVKASVAALNGRRLRSNTVIAKPVQVLIRHSGRAVRP